ncbi:hypothetical protein SbBS512_A0110 (plasmid) [Shigella boydii CDC 3083-94]|uniref:Uncharacterized protein n=1 Tax=Shigella boydii serotype 18 (strain CDC 3083-94 / BS512) TaxID=344609 RepID=B2TST6_SHIB3|nr:hypothetical protein SbBS512_A0110 [Shigella boydii CDC 3083-94]EFZ60389.1 hypothetical protein ECLT68_0328 [Escherichia coli LT-68]EGI89817.1 hypothetical protein SD15574_4741 [Shigella dysenteriae 155-74]EIQ28515.1 hypothetical protein SB96558_2941 [Shigella boydii 965-58]
MNSNEFYYKKTILSLIPLMECFQLVECVFCNEILDDFFMKLN